MGIVGTRKRDTEEDFWIVEDAYIQFEHKHPDDEIIIVSGGCKQGADRFAEKIISKYRLDKRIFEPEKQPNMSYIEFTKACYSRNYDIAMLSDYLIACVDKLHRKGGTENTIDNFVKMGKGEKLILV